MKRSRRAAAKQADKKRDSAKAKKRIGDPFGSMKGTVTFIEGVDLTEPMGEIWNAELGKLDD